MKRYIHGRTADSYKLCNHLNNGQCVCFCFSTHEKNSTAHLRAHGLGGKRMGEMRWEARLIRLPAHTRPPNMKVEKCRSAALNNQTKSQPVVQPSFSTEKSMSQQETHWAMVYLTHAVTMPAHALSKDIPHSPHYALVHSVL